MIWNLFKIRAPSGYATLGGRFWNSKEWESLSNYCGSNEAANSSLSNILVFCSSAGELEQSVPIVDRLLERGHRVVILCFSPSGLAYATKRKYPYYVRLAPTDTLGVWKKIFRIVKPSLVIVVRYELWPAFLSVAAKESIPILINANWSQRLSHSVILRYLYRAIFARFRGIFVVSERDRDNFLSLLSGGGDNPKTRASKQRPVIEVIGETKFDRVRERQLQSKSLVDSIDRLLCAKFGRVRRIIGGSVWHADVEVCVAAFKDVAVGDPSFRSTCQLILAPHDVSERMVSWIEGYIKASGFESIRYSQLEADSQEIPALNGDTVLVVDSVGFLSELYGSCDIAYVGGGLHHRVHNVLEPACYGLPVFFGPRISECKEAIVLVERKLARVIGDSHELAKFWREYFEDGVTFDRNIAQKNVGELCGASQKLLNFLVEKKYLQFDW